MASCHSRIIPTGGWHHSLDLDFIVLCPTKHSVISFSVLRAVWKFTHIISHKQNSPENIKNWPIANHG